MLDSSHVALVLIDLDRHGVPEHAVMYEQLDGVLHGIVDTYEASPFPDAVEFGAWVYRAARRY